MVSPHSHKTLTKMVENTWYSASVTSRWPGSSWVDEQLSLCQWVPKASASAPAASVTTPSYVLRDKFWVTSKPLRTWSGIVLLPSTHWWLRFFQTVVRGVTAHKDDASVVHRAAKRRLLVSTNCQPSQLFVCPLGIQVSYSSRIRSWKCSKVSRIFTSL